ncbi:MAG: adenine phosphoribosyltransferase [Pseudomonadota bacterium]
MFDIIRDRIVDVPDFPKPGIVFKDITPLLADPDAFRASIDLLAERLPADIDALAGIESRGFIFASALAAQTGLPFHLVRKHGKLPRETHGVEYALEYGVDKVEMHVSSLSEGRRYTIVDDLLATGGTCAAAARLVAQGGCTVVSALFLIELAALDGRAQLGPTKVDALLTF